MPNRDISLVCSHNKVRDSKFYGGVNYSDKWEIPVIDIAYRVCNVLVSDDCPTVTFRLYYDYNVCKYYQLYVTLNYLANGFIFAHVIGNSYGSGESKYFGDVVLRFSDVFESDIISHVVEKVCNAKINLVNSRRTAMSYLEEYSSISNEVLYKPLHNNFNYFLR